MKSSHGDWISLNLRGLAIGAYAFVSAVHILISSLGVVLIGRGLLGIHIVSIFLSVGICWIAWMTFSLHVDNKDANRQRERMDGRKKLFHVIDLIEWKFMPNANNPSAISATIKVTESGRFAAHVYGKSTGDYPVFVDIAEEAEQVEVLAGDQFEFVMPLSLYERAMGEDLELRFYLFNDDLEYPRTMASKVYKRIIKVDDDGHDFYEVLPNPKSPSSD